MYYTKDGITLYIGNKQLGDRDATQNEIDTFQINKKVQTVTKLQIMEAMLQTDVTATSNMWNDFKVIRNNDELLNDYWLSALDINRYHPMVLGMIPLMNKSEQDLDNLFLLASIL